MFKILKRKWYKVVEEKELTTIRIGNIRFTIFKEKALKYNECFPNQLGWTDEQVKLREEIRSHNYIPNGKYPKISADNVCLDGHHRLTSLLEYYGEDYEVVVVKSKHTYNRLFWLCILSLPIIKTLYKDDKVLNS